MSKFLEGIIALGTVGAFILLIWSKIAKKTISEILRGVFQND